jgi:hypothetical protein
MCCFSMPAIREPLCPDIGADEIRERVAHLDTGSALTSRLRSQLGAPS